MCILLFFVLFPIGTDLRSCLKCQSDFPSLPRRRLWNLLGWIGKRVEVSHIIKFLKVSWKSMEERQINASAVERTWSLCTTILSKSQWDGLSLSNRLPLPEAKVLLSLPFLSLSCVLSPLTFCQLLHLWDASMTISGWVWSSVAA